MSDRKQGEETLNRVEWTLSKKPSRDSVGPAEEDQGYGDLTELNRDGVILQSIGPELLRDFANDYLELLGTSSAIYEANGDYAFGIFSSGWCRMMDSASRKLCATSDNIEALNSGRWLCHESCWTDCAKEAIANGAPVDIECSGGIRLYAEPIIAHGRVVGAINFGHGDPPKDPETLRKLAEAYNVEYDDLVREAHAYESRPAHIVEMAKNRLRASARVIGSMIAAKESEEEAKRHLRERETILKEVHHRIKNNLASIEGLLSMQADSTESDEAKAALQQAIARIQSMRVLYEKLLIEDDYEEVSIENYIESLVDSLVAVLAGRKNVTVEKDIDDFTLVSKKAVSVGIGINELLTNVFKHAFEGRDEGHVSIDLEKGETHAVLTVRDNGVGVGEGSAANNSSGFGLTIVKMIAEQLNGTYSIQNDNGTRSVLEFAL